MEREDDIENIKYKFKFLFKKENFIFYNHFKLNFI
jgi:hypothetical protein